MATGGTDGSIKLWDLRSSRLIQYYDAHGGAVSDLSFHPSGNFLLSASLDTSLKVGGGSGAAAVAAAPAARVWARAQSPAGQACIQPGWLYPTRL